MKRIRLFGLSIVLILVAATVHAQDDPCSKGTPYRRCQACGSATGKRAQQLNVEKNRDDEATSPDKLTIEEIRDPANNETFSPDKQVYVTGYVASVVPGGAQESCNCGRSTLRDIHINVVANPSEAGNGRKAVIVEFTPRWQEKFGWNNRRYAAMLRHVKDAIEHKWVKFTGWMLYDYFHAGQSESIHPRRRGNWRATPWEVHPITAYQVVSAP